MPRVLCLALALSSYRVGCDCGSNAGQVDAGPPDSGVLDPRLVGYWKFDEPSGTALLDSSGYGNDGTLGWTSAPDALLDPVRVSGLFDGGALLFDGGANLCSVPPSATLDGLGTFTYVAWIYPLGYGGLAFGRVVSKESDAGFDDNYLLVYSFDGTSVNGFGVELDGAQSLDTESADNVITLGAWQQLAVTYDDTTDRLAHLFLNGQETAYVVQPPTTGNFVETSHPFVFGNRPALDRGFYGVIDEVRIYDVALSAPEVAGLYVAP